MRSPSALAGCGAGGGACWASPPAAPGASGGRSQAFQAGDSEVTVEFAEVVAGREQGPLAAGVV